jgi:hypothetical protein
MLFDQKLRPEITPFRVYSLCRLVEYGKYTKDKLKELMQPKALVERQDVFNKVYAFALSGRLIEENPDGIVLLKLKSEEISTTDAFRQAISKVASEDRESLFFKFTQWYMKNEENVWSFTSFEDLAVKQGGDLIDVNKEYTLAWRFWVSFMGFGFLHGSSFIHNPFLRIKDAIEMDKEILRETQIPFRDFVSWLYTTVPELNAGISGNNLSLSVSMALRTLHDNGLVYLKYIPDSVDVWHLKREVSHQIIENISEITIRRW